MSIRESLQECQVQRQTGYECRAIRIASAESGKRLATSCLAVFETLSA